MTKKTRFLIFISFLVAFVVVAPIVVLLTAGYRFSWRGRQVTQASLLRLESVPKGARVVINDALRKETTPATITLAPGDYLVQIEQDGYSQWEKRLVLSPGVTTFAENIRLWKQIPPRLVSMTAATSTVREDVIPPAVRRALAKKLGREIGESTFAHESQYYAVRTGLDSPTLVQVSLDPPAIIREVGPMGIGPTNRLHPLLGGGQFVAFLDDITHILLIRNLNPDATEQLGYQNGAAVARWFKVGGKWVLLFSDGHSLYRYDPTGPQFDATLITRRESKITDFVLFPDNAHALYVAGGVLEVIEFDDRDHRNTARWEGLTEVKDMKLETSLLRSPRLIVSGRTANQGFGLYEIDLD